MCVCVFSGRKSFPDLEATASLLPKKRSRSRVPASHSQKKDLLAACELLRLLFGLLAPADQMTAALLGVYVLSASKQFSGRCE